MTPAADAGVPLGQVQRASVLIDQLKDAVAGSGHPRAESYLRMADRSVEPEGLSRVLVLGETNRGKSRLVNALLGRPDLSPVGRGTTTAAWIEISHADGEEERATVTLVEASGAPEVRAIRVGEIARYACLDSDQVAQRIEVRIDHDLLHHVVLIDSPGTCRIGSGEPGTAMAALDTADAVIFVSDCTQPLLAHELAFLEAATLRVARVVVVATKSDLSSGVSEILAATRGHLDAHPRLAKARLVATSALLAEQVAALGGGAVADSVAKSAGVAALRDVLVREIAPNVTALRYANRLHAAAYAAFTLSEDLQREANAISDDSQPREELEKRREVIRDLRRRGPALQARLRHPLQDGRAQATSAFTARVNETRVRYDRLAQSGSSHELDVLEENLVAELNDAAAAGWASYDLGVERLRAIVTGELEGAGLVTAFSDLPDASALRAIQPTRAGDPAAASGPAETLLGLGVGFSLGRGVAWLLGSLGGPIAWTVGGLAATAGLVAKKRFTDNKIRRQHLREWVRLATSEAASEFTTALGERERSLIQFTDLALPSVLRELEDEVERVELESKRLAAATAEVRTRAQSAVRAQTQVLHRLVKEAVTLEAQILTGARPSKSPAESSDA